jgi:hypothetical protein
VEKTANYVNGFHPKVPEILFLLGLNTGPLAEVYGDGYATIPGLVGLD